MPRNVWLFTRPLAYPIPWMDVTSDGRPYLCHWGVLVSDLTIIDTKVILQTANKGNRTVHLGTMYELMQTEGRSHVFVDTEFTMRELNGWCRIIHWRNTTNA